jgi:hypothetical protein
LQGVTRATLKKAYPDITAEMVRQAPLYAVSYPLRKKLCKPQSAAFEPQTAEIVATGVTALGPMPESDQALELTLGTNLNGAEGGSGPCELPAVA